MEHQLPILLSGSRFKLAVCGRRWGKTATGLLAVLRGHGSKRGMFPGAIDGARIWWVAPSYTTLEASKIWNDLKRATAGAWVDKSEIHRSITLPGGGSVSVRSADDPDSLRGPGLDGVVLDEAAFLKPEVWHDVLRPALADLGGWSFMLTTPNGKNWLHDTFRKAAGRAEWSRWQLPTWENPLIGPEEIESLKQDLGPRRFSQEIAAQFTEVEGACFPGEYFEDPIWADNWPDHFETSVIAVDPSMGRTDQSDYSAIVFVGLTEGLLYVDSDIERRPPLEIVKDTTKMFDRYLPKVVGVESVGFQAVPATLFDLVAQGSGRLPLPLALITHQSKESKTTRVLRLDPYLDNRQIRLKRTEGNDMLLEQLMMFPNKSYHDDGPDALEMALRLLLHAQTSNEEEREYESVYS